MAENKSIGPEDGEEISLETLIDRAKREGGEILASLRRRAFAPRAQVDQWREDVSRGERARAFLGGDLWRKDLEPSLRVQAAMKPLRPDALPASLESATVQLLYQSGAAAQAGALERTLREWVSAGDKAAVLLRAEMEKRKGEKLS